MRAAAGIFGFWQGVGEGQCSQGLGPWQQRSQETKSLTSFRRELCEGGRAIRPQGNAAALNALPIAIPSIPSNARAWRQDTPDENDAFS